MNSPNSMLSQWTPASSVLPDPKEDRQLFTQEEAVDFLKGTARSPTQDIWTIRVRYAECAELFVAGDFNRWSLPGLRLNQWGADIWEASIALEPGAYRFACYVLGRCGFRRISSDCVTCFIENKETTRRIAHAC